MDFCRHLPPQHLLWYAYNTRMGGVTTCTLGLRNDETCREWLALLTPFNTGMITCDDRESYTREFLKDKYQTGNIFIGQRTEGNSLTLCTRIRRLSRKTICFLHSIDIHEKVIGVFIEKVLLTEGTTHAFTLYVRRIPEASDALLYARKMSTSSPHKEGQHL